MQLNKQPAQGIQRRLEIEALGNQYTRIVSICSKYDQKDVNHNTKVNDLIFFLIQSYTVQHLNFVELNFRCFCGYNGFRENYSTKIFNAHERTPIPGRNHEIYSTKTLQTAIRKIKALYGRPFQDWSERILMRFSARIHASAAPISVKWICHTSLKIQHENMLELR